VIVAILVKDSLPPRKSSGKLRPNMKFSLVLVGVMIGCGPGLKIEQPDPKAEGRNALLEASGDAGAIEELFHGFVTEGGLWFEDPACAAQFGNGGAIPPDQQHAFAKCLAALRFNASPREDQLGDVVVMSYPPGIEIEARIVHEGVGPRLAWIGYESRREVDALIPTVTVDTLESVRLTGDRNGPIDQEAAAALALGPGAEPARAWLRVCVDENGAVTLAHPFSTTDPKASAAFEKAALAWTFKPFTIGARVVPICSMVQMTYPTGGASQTEVLPLPPARTRSNVEATTFSGTKAPQKLETHRISGTRSIAPDDAIKTQIQKSHVDKVTGSFRVCLDETGSVESILPLRSTGYASYDRKITTGIQQWKYTPYLIDNLPAPVCTTVTFIYSQRV
jgi:hypothetical protein